MEKINILNLPTPLHETEVDYKNRYFIKRDDLTGFALGGNKARKIEYFLYDIQKRNCDYIVTYGSTESNHCRIVAAAAAKLGLKCSLILEGSKEDFSFAGNDIMYFLSGADIIWSSADEASSIIDSQIENLKKQGHNPYFIPGGGHSNCGTQAYIEAYKEIREQSIKNKIDFDYIFVASGTGTTQAGLIIGKKALNGKENIIGISIAREAHRGIEVINESIEEYIREFHTDILIDSNDIIFDDSYIGCGYADIYKEVVDTIKLMFYKNSIILDPIYTGKAFYGMLEYIKKENITDKNILFVHTGGTPVFFSKGREIVKLVKNSV